MQKPPSNLVESNGPTQLNRTQLNRTQLKSTELSWKNSTQSNSVFELNSSLSLDSSGSFSRRLCVCVWWLPPGYYFAHVFQNRSADLEIKGVIDRR